VTHVLAVVTDRAHARFFDVGASEAVELTSLQSPAGRGGRFHSDRGDSPGWGEHAYHARREEEARRHVAAIVERLAAFERYYETLATPFPSAILHRLRKSPRCGRQRYLTCFLWRLHRPI